MKNKIFIFSLLLLVLSGLQSCGKDEALVEKQSEVPVKLAPVELKRVKIPMRTSGRLVTAREQKLSFKIGGIIRKIWIDEGQSVKTGQRLAQLNLVEIESGFARAKSAFEKATRDLTRVQQLYQDSVATLEQLQDAKTGLTIARSNLESAKFNLKHATIYAPGDGKILKRLFSENEMINAGMPVFFWGSTNSWVVRTGVAESEIVKLQLGDSATVRFDAYPQLNFPAEVTEIAETIDPTSGTFEVELRLRPTRHRLIAGFVAKVEIFPATNHDLYWVPVEALVEGDGKRAAVFSVDDQFRAKKIMVHISHIFEKYAGIDAGLENVTEVVTDGAAYLTESALVKIVGRDKQN